jgi:hypothetical protein
MDDELGRIIRDDKFIIPYYPFQIIPYYELGRTIGVMNWERNGRQFPRDWNPGPPEYKAAYVKALQNKAATPNTAATGPNSKLRHLPPN